MSIPWKENLGLNGLGPRGRGFESLRPDRKIKGLRDFDRNPFSFTRAGTRAISLRIPSLPAPIPHPFRDRRAIMLFDSIAAHLIVVASVQTQMLRLLLGRPRALDHNRLDRLCEEAKNLPIVSWSLYQLVWVTNRFDWEISG